MDQMIVQSNKLIFRKTTKTDLEFVLTIEKENNPFVSSWTTNQHIQAIQSLDKEHIIIQNTLTGDRVGYLIMTDLHNIHGSYYLKRFVIDDKRKGFGRETLKLLKTWCFTELKAHRLYLDVKEFNERALKLYKSEGFTIEGIARECRKEGDQYISLISMSILKKEYQTRIN